MFRITVELTGIAKRGQVTALMDDLLDAAETQMQRETEIMLALSMAQVPVEDFDLVKSGKVSKPKKQRHDIRRRAIHYGGPAVKAAGHGFDYALIQETNEQYNHPRGGKAHFLRDPVMAYGQTTYPVLMAAAIIHELKKHRI